MGSCCGRSVKLAARITSASLASRPKVKGNTTPAAIVSEPVIIAPTSEFNNLWSAKTP